jgi:molybdate transport system substrate-binding protein
MSITRAAKIALVLAYGLTTIATRAGTITVFAAASLTDSLKKIAGAYEQKTGDKIEFNFAASSVLERQIEEGAPADIFFSADEAKMDTLEKKGLIDKSTRKSRLSNALVIVTPSDSTIPIVSPKDLTSPSVNHIALGDTRSVPAGIYARKYLQKIGLWHDVEPKVVPTVNVRAALAAVESGDAEAGIVYKTDAAISKKVHVAFIVPRADAPVISYPMAVTKDAKDPKAAHAFLDYLNSEDAGKTFEKFGFILEKHTP